MLPDVSNTAPTLTPQNGQAPKHDHTPDSLVQAQLRFQGCTLERLEAVEIQCGREFDPGVCKSDLERIATLRHESQTRFASNLENRRAQGGEAVLFAPTSRMADHMVDGRGISLLLKALCAQGLLEEFLKALDGGPGGGKIIWEPPTTPAQLMASILRWPALASSSDKTRIRVSQELRGWMRQAFIDANYDTNPRLGGVSAVGASLGKALAHHATMLALGDLPSAVRGYLPDELAVVHEHPEIKTVAELPLSPDNIGNFCITFSGSDIELPPEMPELFMNGSAFDPSCITHGEPFITGASAPRGFGSLPRERLAELAQKNSLMVLSGLQSLGAVEGDINHYLSNVAAMHAQGCPVGVLYSKPSFPDAEVKVWQTIREKRCVDFIGLNCVEAFEVLERIRESIAQDNPLRISASQAERLESALSIARELDTIWDTGRENPAWVFRSAELLQEFTGIPLVRVRARAIDTLICDKNIEVKNHASVRDSLFTSRDMATLKVANKTGLIDEHHELSAVKNVPFGYFIAAHRLVSDLVDVDYRILGTPTSQDLKYNCFAVLPDGRTLFAIPPCPFFERAGGTTSAGDTMDVTFLTEQIFGIILAAHRASRAD